MKRSLCLKIIRVKEKRMYRNEKKTLLEICSTMREAHEAIVRTVTPEEKMDILNACQQAAIRIGEALEKEDNDKYGDTVNKLEDYCELIFSLSSPQNTDETVISTINDIADETAEVIKNIKHRIKIAFFPYKAEMWDSLESFYLAAREDPDCDAFLVPIPYYEFDSEKNDMIMRYDGSRFPAAEDPIPFNRFDHTDGSIDIAYIHYPYDDHNLVTTVHPAYYSKELKKYVDKLIYAPYYVTAGFIEDNHLNFSVYKNMDYAVFQSEAAKRCCEGHDYYDKILPFGSSKLDMVINKCKRGVEIPEEWKAVIGNKRTLMLNSSIGDMLSSNDAVLDKLEYFFDLIKNDDRLAVIWRPHPLLESTFRSMRPGMLERYERIKEKFIRDKIGVFDTTPDISDTVAIADGYIGSSGSSVINLFAAAGKPVFIFNNMLREPVGDDDRRILSLSGLEYMRGRYYMHPSNINAVFSLSASDISSGIKYEGSVPDVTDWTCSLTGLVRAGDKLYMSPYFADDAVCFDPVMKTVERLGAVGRQYNVRFGGINCILPSRKSVFFIPANNKFLIMEYAADRKKWIYHQECLAKLHEGIIKPSYIGMTYGGAVYNERIYYSLGICNRIMMLEAGTGRYEILYLGKPELTEDIPVVLNGASKEGLWVVMGGTSDIYLAPWESLSDIDSWRAYHMPDGFEFTHDDLGDPYGAHGGILEHGDDMIIFPYRAPVMMKLNKKSGDITYMAEDFFKDSDKKGIGYELKYSGICSAGCYVGTDKYALQRARDLHVAVIDLNDGSYEEFVPEIPKDVFEKLVPEDAGFFKGDIYDYFRMDESRLFPLENFLSTFAKDGYKDVKKRQLKELSTFAANLDGTCGIKTHRFLKQVIMEEGL